MTGPRVLIVEDDKALRTALERALRFDGYDVTEAGDGTQGLEALTNSTFDAVVLDLGLPNIDGLTLCRMLRDQGRSDPVIMLTARTEIPDKIAGLDAGADDYLAKPFSIDELLARIRALLRRPETATNDQTTELVAGDLVVNPTTRTVIYDGETVELTKLEFDLLELLVANKNIVVRRDTIYERIWGYDFETRSRSLDVTISYLRTKLEANNRPRAVHTVRGVGYVVRATPS